MRYGYWFPYHASLRSIFGVVEKDTMRENDLSMRAFLNPARSYASDRSTCVDIGLRSRREGRRVWGGRGL